MDGTVSTYRGVLTRLQDSISTRSSRHWCLHECIEDGHCDRIAPCNLRPPVGQEALATRDMSLPMG